jgi:hypothetical protein
MATAPMILVDTNLLLAAYHSASAHRGRDDGRRPQTVRAGTLDVGVNSGVLRIGTDALPDGRGRLIVDEWFRAAQCRLARSGLTGRF